MLCYVMLCYVMLCMRHVMYQACGRDVTKMAGGDTYVMLTLVARHDVARESISCV